MSSEMAQISVELNAAGMNIKETELTLGLPGDQSTRGLLMKSGMKRGYLDMVDLKLGSSSTTSEVTDNCPHRENSLEVDQSETENSNIVSKLPHRSKEQVVGWPPVRACRKSTHMRMKSSCKYVKVAVDGAPYLRKVDLEMYSSYEQLLGALEEMLACFSVCKEVDLNDESKLVDPAVNRLEYCVPTYEDKDGDWMLVGDVPWKMFVETCNRLRLMKNSETVGLAPPKCSSSSS